MKSSKLFFAALLMMVFGSVFAQVEQIELVQTVGKFTTESLHLPAGDYQFNVANQGVDHELGFVLVPKGKYDEAHHIKEAYVKKPVASGHSSMTNVVKLTPGQYEYFCPLNPTPKYTLTVTEAPEVVKLDQVVGDFKVKSLTLTEGTYQFEIGNVGIDHEVGFVLVPKGMYDEGHHIKEAYVKAPVSNGKTSMTSVVRLTPGQYEYFCPLNPTPKYTLTVTE